MTEVINLHLIKTDLNEWAKDPNHVYIGRENRRLPDAASKWGNPITPINQTYQAQYDCVEKFKRLITTEQPEFLDDIEELRGKKLGCWCPPAPCHGTVYVEELKKREKDQKLSSEQDKTNDNEILKVVHLLIVWCTSNLKKKR